MGGEPIAVVLDPRRQPRPLAEQGLVGEVDVGLVDDQQAGADQRLHHVADGRAERVADLVERHRAPRDRTVVTDLDEPEEQCREPLRGGVQLFEEDVVGGAGDGAAGTTGGDVVRHREVVIPAATPRLEHRVRQQWERIGLPREVSDDEIGQPPLDVQPGGRGGVLDDATKGIVVESPEQDRRLPGERREAGVLGAPGVEVAAQAERHPGQ